MSLVDIVAKKPESKIIIAPDQPALDQPDEDNGFFVVQPKRRSRKQLVMISLAIIFALSIIVVLGLWLVGNRTVAVTGCTIDQLKAAKTAIGAKDSAKLSMVSADIQKNKQYRQDVNCLYVVAASDVYQGEYGKAVVSYNAFYGKYDEQTGLNKAVSNNSTADIRVMSKAMAELGKKYDQVLTDSEDLL